MEDMFTPMVSEVPRRLESAARDPFIDGCPLNPLPRTGGGDPRATATPTRPAPAKRRPANGD
jgi:hypothetical protein